MWTLRCATQEENISNTASRSNTLPILGNCNDMHIVPYFDGRTVTEMKECRWWKALIWIIHVHPIIPRKRHRTLSQHVNPHHYHHQKQLPPTLFPRSAGVEFNCVSHNAHCQRVSSINYCCSLISTPTSDISAQFAHQQQQDQCRIPHQLHCLL
jgi:hypothetical protein